MADVTTTTISADGKQVPATIIADKKPWTSKTYYAAIIVAIAPAFPPVAAWITANPGMFSIGLGVLFGILRTVTKGKISINDDTSQN